MDRRDFLRTTAAVSLAAEAIAAQQDFPKRKYKDDVQLSTVGFGGIVVVGQEQAAANRQVAASFDRGINYYDVAPTYGDGEAEQKLGPALKPYRNRVFLACKTTNRDAAGARAELEQSLRRLETDHFDLYQFHAVSSMKDVEQILAPGGAAEVFRKAKEEGKARYLGMSAHNAEAAIALMDRFPCDSVLFPVNFVAFSEGSFGPQILEHAKKKGVARLALKAMARGRWPDGADKSKYPKCWYEPVQDPELQRQAVRFTLSEDVTAAIPPGDEKLYERMLELAASFKPLSSSERKQLLAKAAGVEPIFKS
jgi:aryl-alcohol dehydrogenase-like predicted oxidoreductase